MLARALTYAMVAAVVYLLALLAYAFLGVV